MTPENVAAFNRLVSVMTGDYAELLIRGLAGRAPPLLA